MNEQVRELTRRLEELITFIGKAEMNVEKGLISDLGNLDASVSKLCSDVEASDPVNARALQPLMGEMIMRLDALAAALEDFRDTHKTGKG